MEVVKKIFKERANGLLLIFLAVFIVSGFLLNSHFAQSKNSNRNENLTEIQADEQVLGETDANSEEITANENQSADSPKENQEKDNNEITETAETKPDSEDITYEELKDHLKKYCDNKFDTKKCRKYLLKAKDARKEGKRFVELYKKYHFEPKKEEKKTDDSSSSADSGDIKEEATLTINYVGSKDNDNYTIIIGSGMTVMDMMREAKKNNGLSYDESTDWPGYIQEINNVREDISNNIFWMLQYNGEMASEGASTLKVKSGDKIEWKYMEVSW